MRPKKHRTTGSNDLFRARLDQIINMKNELVQLAGKIDWDWINREVVPLFSENGPPGIETRFMIGLLLLKDIYGPGGVRSVASRPPNSHIRFLRDPTRCIDARAPMQRPSGETRL